MRLRDRYDGGDDPFEGERTIVWRSLPADAVVTKASLTLGPLMPPGADSYTEMLHLGRGGPAFGATVGQPASGIVEVNFHARRTATRIANLRNITARTLSVDIGGGVFLAVGADGTIPAQPGSAFDFSGGALPGITALRLRLAQASLPAAPASVAIDIASMPSNVTLRFGKLPPFWSQTGELGVATTTPDVTNAIQRAIADAAVTNGFSAIPLVVHSDTLGRLAITIDVEYLGASPLVAPGLREVVLPFDYASVSTTAPSALQATLPAGAKVVARQTALQVRGAFDASRIAYGPSGTTAESTTIHCSASETLAQPVVPHADIDVSGVDLFVAADGPAARLALDLRADFDGKPAPTSLLAKAIPFDLAGDAAKLRRWTSVPIAPSAQLQQGTRYWVVVQALDGAGFLGVDVPPDRDRLIQRSSDAGFSWRAARLYSPLLLRLRTLPDRFHMPIDFVAGAGPQAQRVSLGAYDPLGKIDAVIDRPEIAAAVQSYVAQAAGAPCATIELLQNPDFAAWTAPGTTLRSPSTIGIGTRGALALIDTFFDTPVMTFSPGSGPPQALAYSPDGTILYVAATNGIAMVDVASFAVSPLVSNLPAPAVALAADPRGRALYAVDGARLTATDLATKQTTFLLTVQGAAALAVARDGASIYVAGMAETVAFDLVTGAERYRIAGGSPALALTPDGATLVGIDQANGLVVTFDAATGAGGWAASLPRPGASARQPVPRAVAFAADDASLYAVGSTDTALVLYAFDPRGRVLPNSVTLPIAATMAAIAVKPQGDRIYIADAALALDPAGGQLAAGTAGDPVAAVAVGERQPANWTLTAGGIAPQPSTGNPLRIQARLSEGSVSQVVAVAPGCPHDFTVISSVTFADEKGPAPDAVAEIFWLDATGGSLRGDSLSLPRAASLVTQRRRFSPPPASAQAEIRIRVAGGDCVLQTVSLKSSDTLLQAEAWQSDPTVPSLIAITQDAGAITYRNLGTGEGAVVQQATLATTRTYQLDFVGRAILGAANVSPYIELRYQDASGANLAPAKQIAIEGPGFAAQPAQLIPPASSASATVRIVLPPGAGLAVDRLALLPRPTVSLPCSFVAQSPGELHVSNARIVYDTQAAPPPSPPPGGLSSPTPPDVTPGDRMQSCGCDDGPPVAVQQPGRVMTLPTPIAVRSSLVSPRAIAVREPPLIAIKGIGPGRQRRLIGAGITTISDLATATPETVAAALGRSTATVELGRILIDSAKTMLAVRSAGGQQ